MCSALSRSGGEEEARNHLNTQLPFAYEKMISAKQKNVQKNKDAHLFK